MVLPNQPNCGCRATRTDRGATCRFTILRRCGLSSRLLGSVGSSRFASDGCIKANASTFLRLYGDVGDGRRTGGEMFFDCRRGNDVGRAVSKTMRSGHFRSE